MRKISSPALDMDIASRDKLIFNLSICNLRLKKLTLVVFIALIAPALYAQKVGLVLSGGGGPGIAHIGVLKALEENDIPVDYITSTSIGAIVGGMYAMGMSPDEMIHLFKSDDFKLIGTGETATSNQYHYFKADPKPEIIRFDIDPVNLSALHLPTSLIAPHEMNYTFVPLCAQATALCRNNFDSLFVPFRCVASDVYNKKTVVFSHGNLSDVICASMTFPFVFKPMEIDTMLLYDGGIYNNFPANIMKDTFAPEYTIGSVVAYNPPKANKRDIGMQLQNMIVHPTDYRIASANGLLLNFDLKKYNTFDFSKIDELVKIGYDSTMAHMAEIKMQVSRRTSQKELTAKRTKFRNRFLSLEFGKIVVTGIRDNEKPYVERFFQTEKEALPLKDFKKAYYRLISGDRFIEIIPRPHYNDSAEIFDLNLSIEKYNPFKVSFGGNISSVSSNQAFIGLTYQTLAKWVTTSYIDGQIGKLYSGLSFGARIELPVKTNSYLKFVFNMHQFDHNSLIRQESYAKLSLGIPFLSKALLEFGGGYGQQNNACIQATGIDKSRFTGLNAFVRAEHKTLNSLMYPTKGNQFSASVHYFSGVENFLPETDLRYYYPNTETSWWQFRLKSDLYFRITNEFTLGTYGELHYSTRQHTQSYTATLMQSTAFEPTPYTRSVFNAALCASQFASIGLKPIYTFSNQLHLRTEGYWFVPYQTINRNADNSVYYSKPFSTTQFIAESALVYNFNMASAALFANYSSNQWHVGVNIGILLFKPKFED